MCLSSSCHRRRRNWVPENDGRKYKTWCLWTTHFLLLSIINKPLRCHYHHRLHHQTLENLALPPSHNLHFSNQKSVCHPTPWHTRIATLLFPPGRSDLDSMYYSTDTWILGWPRISASSNLSHSWLGRVCMYRILGPYIGSIAWCGIREWINWGQSCAFQNALDIEIWIGS